MIGFPLRLLAREVYDRVVKLKGANHVALVTGEEKIIPPDARWYLCTAEAMPLDRDFAFVAIDEAQLATDPERGHIFTDRLLHARGRDETMILGSESLRPLIAKLLPEAEIITRPRFSTLSWAGPRKLSRLPRRSAIVAFSVEDVYAIAEMLRRKHGGAALVMGSLSPQTRNAQVKMYQDGEVDFLVATDAIGMGLNLDVSHVAFAALTKFDGKRRRRLTVAEIGQIAGRAGRHQKDGSFGVLAGLTSSDELLPEEIENLEEHRFPRLEWLYWRNARPDMKNVASLIASLEQRPRDPLLRAAPEAVDLAVLKRLAQDPAVVRLATSPEQVRILWEVASIPDFRKVGADHQARFAASLWPYLASGSGKIPHSRMAQEIARLENVQGDIATLAARIAAARSWSYIAQKARWVEQAEAMVQRTRALETRLSDAMHSQLTQRFVDQRTRILTRGFAKDFINQRVTVEDDGIVLVEGVKIGTLRGFQFVVPSDSRREDRKMLLAAAERYLGQTMTQNADALAKAPDSVLSLAPDEHGLPVILWGDEKLATLVKGKNLLHPEIKYDRSLKDLTPENLKKVETRVAAWVEAMMAKHLDGLIKLEALANAAETPPPMRALFIRIGEAGGIIDRREVHADVRNMDNELRGHARRAGLVFGALDIYHHSLMKPGAVLWRTALFAALDGQPMAPLTPDNAVHLKQWPFADATAARRFGFRIVGDEYIRVDLAERLVKQAHDTRVNNPVFAVDMALATSLGLSLEVHGALLQMAGFVRADPPADVQAATAVPAAAEPAAEDQNARVTPSENEDVIPAISPAITMAHPDVGDAHIATSESAFDQSTAVTDESNANGAHLPEPAEASAALAKPPAPIVYWRWKGMVRPAAPYGGKARDSRPPRKPKYQEPKVSRKAEPIVAKAGGAFAELAALKELMKK